MSLLLEIARCPVAQACMGDASYDHRCTSVVRSQGKSLLDDWQVPEPWSGHLDSAPILFIGSNPSIGGLKESAPTSEREKYPRWGWPDDLISDFFTNRFAEGKEAWVVEDKFSLMEDDSRGKQWVRFWAAVKRRAAELLEISPSAVRPGIDYTISEVVHCKSRNQVGVQEALVPCVERYLHGVIEESGARVIVALGDYAAAGVRSLLTSEDQSPICGPIAIGDRDRYIAFIPHPNARKVRSFAGCLTPDEVQCLRNALRQ